MARNQKVGIKKKIFVAEDLIHTRKKSKLQGLNNNRVFLLANCFISLSAFTTAP